MGGRRPAACLWIAGLAVLAPSAGAVAAERPPRLVALRAGDLRATVAPDHGGELAGLQLRRGGRWIQLLYRGDDYSETKDWSGKAPVLWPATGRTVLPLGDPQAGAAAWRWKGVAYPMAIHGFARDLPWSLARVERGRGRSRAVLWLQDTGWTRARYPFGFRVTSEYVLTGRALTIRQTVRAAVLAGER